MEKGDTILELTRHGKKVAVVKSPEAVASTPDMESWIGSGKGTVTFGPDYDPNAPAWNASDSKILKYRQVASIASRKA